jgi:hypothetical protein
MSQVAKRVAPYLPDVLIGTVAIVAIGLLVYVLIRLTGGPAQPLQYTQSVYAAERPIYAPGDTMSYTATLTIERSGGVRLIRGWRTMPGAARARLCNGENAPVIEDVPPPFPASAVGHNVEGRVSVVVPDLPPGDYRLVSTVYKFDGGESLTEVPVRIIKLCDG